MTSSRESIEPSLRPLEVGSLLRLCRRVVVGSVSERDGKLWRSNLVKGSPHAGRRADRVDETHGDQAGSANVRGKIDRVEVAGGLHCPGVLRREEGIAD